MILAWTIPGAYYGWHISGRALWEEPHISWSTLPPKVVAVLIMSLCGLFGWLALIPAVTVWVFRQIDKFFDRYIFRNEQ